MKLKTLLLVCIITSLSTQSAAQSNHYDLSDFKIKEFRYHALNTYFSFNHINRHSGEDNMVGAEDNESSSAFTGNFSSDYLSYTSDSSWQTNTSARLNFSGSFSSTYDEDRVERKNNTLFSGLFLESSFRNYFRLNNNFNEIGLLINATRNKFKNRYSFNGAEFSRDSSTFRNLSLALPLRLGAGRIDQVTDARHAIFILNKLKKEQKLSKDLNPEELLAFAQLIADIKNKRFFDFRLRQIYELEAIDSFLQSNNFITDPNIRYFTTLSDMWRFGNSPVRFSGERFALALLPGYKYFNQSVNFISEGTRFKIFNIHLGLEYIKEKPLNLYTQNTFEFFGYLGIARAKLKTNDQPEEKISVPKINFGFNEKIGFYPNTRTSMEYSVSLQYARIYDFLNPRDLTTEIDNRGLNISSYVNISYYFSPRLRATGNASISYSLNKTSENLTINNNDVLINNQLLFLFNTPQCGSQDCNFNFDKKKNYFTNINLSLSYSFF